MRVGTKYYEKLFMNYGLLFINYGLSWLAYITRYDQNQRKLSISVFNAACFLKLLVTIINGILDLVLATATDALNKNSRLQFDCKIVKSARALSV